MADDDVHPLDVRDGTRRWIPRLVGRDEAVQQRLEVPAPVMGAGVVGVSVSVL